jgi:hypothetical protein
MQVLKDTKPQLTSEELSVLVHCLRGFVCRAYTTDSKEKAAFAKVAIDLGAYLHSQKEPERHGPIYLANRLGQLYCLLEIPTWRTQISQELEKLDLHSELLLLARPEIKRGDRFMAKTLRSHFSAGEEGIVITENLGAFNNGSVIQRMELQTYVATQLLGYEIDFLMIAQIETEEGKTKRFGIVFELDGRRFHLRSINETNSFQRVQDFARDSFFDECGLFTIRLDGNELNSIQSLSGLAALVQRKSRQWKDNPNALFLERLIEYWNTKR